MSATKMLDPARLGITPASVHANHARLVTAGGSPSSPAFQEMFSYDRVVEALRQELTRDVHSTHSVEVRVSLDGPGGFAVGSQSDEPAMLPWHVTMKGRSWETYSIAVADAIAPVLATNGPNHDIVARGSSYWRDGVWDDGHIWMVQAARATLVEKGTRIATAAAGYDEAQRRFVIIDASAAGTGGPLAVTFEPRRGIISRATWSSDLDARGQPHEAWAEVGARFDAVEKQLDRGAWARAWRGEHPQGTIEISLTAHPRTRVEERAAWTYAGHRGLPTIEVTLRDGTSSHGGATLWLGREDDRGLVTRARTDAGTLWLDGQHFSLSADAEFVTVDASGHATRGSLK